MVYHQSQFLKSIVFDLSMYIPLFRAVFCDPFIAGLSSVELISAVLY